MLWKFGSVGFMDRDDFSDIMRYVFVVLILVGIGAFVVWFLLYGVYLLQGSMPNPEPNCHKELQGFFSFFWR